MRGQFAGSAIGLSSSLRGRVAVALSDTTLLSQTTRQVIFDAAGAVSVLWEDGGTSSETVAAGDVRDWLIDRFNATGTTLTAAQIRAYY
jgi:hypothetical protein